MSDNANQNILPPEVEELLNQLFGGSIDPENLHDQIHAEQYVQMFLETLPPSRFRQVPVNADGKTVRVVILSEEDLITFVAATIGTERAVNATGHRSDPNAHKDEK